MCNSTAVHMYWHLHSLTFKHYIIITSLQFWQRRSAVYSFSWNTYSYSAAEEVRPDYHGNTVTDPVTGKPTTYYPAWKRRLWYIFSFLAMLPLLLVGVAVMTLSLNLNGYVKDPHSPIFVAQLAKFAKPVTFNGHLQYEYALNFAITAIWAHLSITSVQSDTKSSRY